MATDVQVPPLGESITQAVLLKWHKSDGDAVQRDEPLCELETDKANVDVPAPESGVLRQLKKAGETVNVGEKLARIEAGTPAAVKAAAVAPIAKPQAAPASVAAPPVVAPATPVAPVPKAVSDTSGIRREPMSKIRKRIAENLVQAQHTAAILTTINEVDMTAVMKLREKFKDRFMEIHGVGLGIVSFFARAVVVAARQFPRVNAFIDGDDVVYHDYVNLGIAVSTDRGLAVPVLRNVENMSFGQIELAIKRVATATREGKLALDELSGGTFTITNGGVFGSLLSTPILSPPQSAILGLHAIQKRPVAIDDKVEIRPMMYVALSYDHRLVDGRESVSFLVRVKQLVEDPARLALEI